MCGSCTETVLYLSKVSGSQGGGGNPFANMGNLMENMKKAQEMVKVEAERVQEELARLVLVAH